MAFLRHPDIAEIISYRNDYVNRLDAFIDQVRIACQSSSTSYSHVKEYLSLAVQDTDLEQVILSALDDGSIWHQAKKPPEHSDESAAMNRAW